MSRRTVWGLQVPASPYRATRSLIATPEQTPRGNVALRVGHETEAGRAGWSQLAYVVLTPVEALQLASALVDAADTGIRPAPGQVFDEPIDLRGRRDA